MGVRGRVGIVRGEFGARAFRSQPVQHIEAGIAANGVNTGLRVRSDSRAAQSRGGIFGLPGLFG